jgi:hypothetical protein
VTDWKLEIVIRVTEPVESIQEDTDLEDLSPPPYSVSRLPYSGAPLLETHAGEWVAQHILYARVE